jgi:tetratricopeptide (TPR) repeat protein
MKYNESENFYKKILELAPSNIITLKRIAKFLLNRKDYSNAYTYINKALKLDDKESELWQLLSVYYVNCGDNAKYYECILKELDISKFHTNSYLFDLIPKVII